MSASADNHHVSLTLDDDALKLLFRNALAQKAVRTSAGLLIMKLAAVNRTCLDSISRVTNQFSEAILNTDKIALKRDYWKAHAIVITRSEFVWMVQWQMLRLKTLTIASKKVGGWHSLVELFQMPSLRVLRCARPLRRRRLRTISTSSVILAYDIVKLNSNNIQELDGVPVWKLSEPLPPMHLKRFIYDTQNLLIERLDNLSRCTIDALEVCTSRSQVPLDFLADVDASEIDMFFYRARVGVDHFTVTEGATNSRVRRIGFYVASLQLSDVQLFHSFFPNLAEIQISDSIENYHRGQPIPHLLKLHEIHEYLTSAPAMPVLCGNVDLTFREEQGVTHNWTVENALDQFGRQHEMRAALAHVPPQIEVWSLIVTDFHHVGESQAKEADKLASQLGFRRVDYDDGVNEYELRTELAPDRELCYCWRVPAGDDSHV